MKCKGMCFFAGLLTALILGASSLSALAADGMLTVTIHPIEIMVNGETFHPKDVNGNEVMTFSISGTSYAAGRALAEGYGLEVGYDDTTNTATVNRPVKQATSLFGDFNSQWEIKEKPVTHYGNEKIFTATYSGSLSMNDFRAWWKSFDSKEITAGVEALAAEIQRQSPGYTVTMYFSYGTYNLGTAWAFGDLAQSDLRPAAVWIK